MRAALSDAGQGTRLHCGARLGSARLQSGFRVACTGAQVVARVIVREIGASTPNSIKQWDHAVVSLRSAWEKWQSDGRSFWQQMDALVETLDGLDQR